MVAAVLKCWDRNLAGLLEHAGDGGTGQSSCTCHLDDQRGARGADLPLPDLHLVLPGVAGGFSVFEGRWELSFLAVPPAPWPVSAAAGAVAAGRLGFVEGFVALCRSSFLLQAEASTLCAEIKAGLREPGSAEPP